MHRADNLTTFMCRLSRNLGASTSWNPKDLSRLVMGLLYLLTILPNVGYFTFILTFESKVLFKYNRKGRARLCCCIKFLGPFYTLACYTTRYINNGYDAVMT
jgi:hypothetical protein